MWCPLLIHWPALQHTASEWGIVYYLQRGYFLFFSALTSLKLSEVTLAYILSLWRVVLLLSDECFCWGWGKVPQFIGKQISDGIKRNPTLGLVVPDGLPAVPPGSLALAGPWCSEAPEARPSTSWKLLLCLPHIWWICMAASRSATRSRSCWARWALSCLISNWEETRKLTSPTHKTIPSPIKQIHTCYINVHMHFCTAVFACGPNKSQKLADRLSTNFQTWYLRNMKHSHLQS